jgi:hypothetical protein
MKKKTKKTMKKKGAINAGMTAIAAIAVVAVLALAYVLVIGSPVSEQGAGVDTYSFAGLSVKDTIKASNLYTGAGTDGVVYIYDQKPANYGNCRSDVEEGYIDSGTVDATTGYTMQEEPGTYYVRFENSTFYCEYITVTIPATGEVPLSDYNAEPPVSKLKALDIDTVTIAAQDFGLATNASTDTDLTKVTTVSISDNEAFKMDEVKLQEDATYAFATDTDGDGIYDEGIRYMKYTVSSDAGVSCSFVPFDVDNSVNMFETGDVATMDCNTVFSEEGLITITLKVTCDATLDATGDADEKCGDGEDFIDSTIFVDQEGNTVTYDYTF